MVHKTSAVIVQQWGKHANKGVVHFLLVKAGRQTGMQDLVCARIMRYQMAFYTA